MKKFDCYIVTKRMVKKMWRVDQSLRSLVEENRSDDEKRQQQRLTKRNVDGQENSALDESSITVGEYRRDNDEAIGSNTDQVNWYERFNELYASTIKARTILSIGLIVVNILVGIYVLLMYTFVSSKNVASPPHGTSDSASNATTTTSALATSRGDNVGDSIWRTAGFVTILNGIPVITAINLLAGRK